MAVAKGNNCSCGSANQTDSLLNCWLNCDYSPIAAWWLCHCWQFHEKNKNCQPEYRERFPQVLRRFWILRNMYIDKFLYCKGFRMSRNSSWTILGRVPVRSGSRQTNFWVSRNELRKTTFPTAFHCLFLGQKVTTIHTELRKDLKHKLWRVSALAGLNDRVPQIWGYCEQNSLEVPTEAFGSQGYFKQSPFFPGLQPCTRQWCSSLAFRNAGRQLQVTHGKHQFSEPMMDSFPIGTFFHRLLGIYAWFSEGRPNFSKRRKKTWEQRMKTVARLLRGELVWGAAVARVGGETFSFELVFFQTQNDAQDANILKAIRDCGISTGLSLNHCQVGTNWVPTGFWGTMQHPTVILPHVMWPCATGVGLGLMTGHFEQMLFQSHYLVMTFWGNIEQ